MKNIHYQTQEISRYFQSNRNHWEDLYPSEQVVIERLNINGSTSVLDVGCGCAGLYNALTERYKLKSYTGIEINEQAAKIAQATYPQQQIIHGDILEVSNDALADKSFDCVVSLSCIDWNLRFDEMLEVLWKHVAPGGVLLCTLRLTSEASCLDFSRSFQYINFDYQLEGERAPYFVLNADEALAKLQLPNACKISAYGYWGKPSPTAVTPYQQVCFGAYSVRKSSEEAMSQLCEFELDLPDGLLNSPA